MAIGCGRVLGEKMAKQHEQRRQMVAKLEAALEENAGLHAQLVTQAREAGVLDERQRMAREIHDTLAQGFAGIITQVQAGAAGTPTDRPRPRPGAPVGPGEPGGGPPLRPGAAPVPADATPDCRGAR